MRVVNSDATTALFDLLEGLSERPHESWQCVYLKPVSANDSPNAAYLAEHAKAITELLARMKGTIYLCEDGDIIILFQRRASEVVERLSSCLGDIAHNPARTPHTHNLFGVFDLGKHWQGFYSLCVNKYLKIIARAEERHLFHTVSASPQAPASLTEHYPAAAAN